MAMRNLVVAVVLAALALGLPATGSVGAPMPVAKIGSVIPLTGRYGSGGAQVRAGYELAVDDINRGGGVMVGGQRVQLQLSILDDESDPTKTVTRIETLAGQGVVALLGGFASDMHAAAAPVAEKDKIPYCGVAFACTRSTSRGSSTCSRPSRSRPTSGRKRTAC
jgi:branched-chain amino acid transport system substrate-binding protein